MPAARDENRDLLVKAGFPNMVKMELPTGGGETPSFCVPQKGLLCRDRGAAPLAARANHFVQADPRRLAGHSNQ